MSSLKSVGKAASVARDTVTKLEVETLLAQGVSVDYVNQKVSDEVALRASKSYVDAQDSSFALTSYATSQDNLLIPTSQLGVANGVASLDSGGRISTSVIPPGGLGCFRGPYMPTYSRDSVGVTTAGGDWIWQWNLPAPGFGWRPLVFGTGIVRCDAGTRGDIQIEMPDGAICAAGRSMNESASCGYYTAHIVPASTLPGQSGVPITGYVGTQAVAITGKLYNMFGGMVDCAGTDVDAKPVLYLIRAI